MSTFQSDNDKVQYLLSQAKSLQDVSLLQSEDLFKQACNMVICNQNTLPPTTCFQAFFDLSQFYSNVARDEDKSVTLSMLAVFMLEEKGIWIDL